MPVRPGPSHVNWRGPDATKRAKHYRINTVRGKPLSCIWGCRDVRRYEWANLTGDYDDIWDYAPMCTPCHRRYDNARRSMEPSFARHPGGAKGSLDADQIRAIRSRIKSGVSQQAIAREVGLSATLIHDIAIRRVYAWVQ